MKSCLNLKTGDRPGQFALWSKKVKLKRHKTGECPRKSLWSHVLVHKFVFVIVFFFSNTFFFYYYSNQPFQMAVLFNKLKFMIISSIFLEKMGACAIICPLWLRWCWDHRFHSHCTPTNHAAAQCNAIWQGVKIDLLRHSDKNTLHIVFFFLIRNRLNRIS